MIGATGRVIMISGASRGIGRALATCLQGKGYRLSLGARRPESLAEFGPGVIACPYDALDLGSAEAWVARTETHFGRIDGLVNNAGMLLSAGVEDPDEAAFDRLWQVNVKGPLRLTRLALPALKRAGNGRIVNLASLSGKRVRGANAAYPMSKYAVMALSHATRRTGWDHGVRVTAVCPAWVATDMAAGAEAATDDMIQPADLAELIATVIALPNNAAIAELLVNCRFEDAL